MSWLKKLMGNKTNDEVADSYNTKPTTDEERRAILNKEKQEATDKGEAWVGVLDTQINPDNIKNGFFELD